MIRELSNIAVAERDLQDLTKLLCKCLFGVACSERLGATAAIVCIDQLVDYSKLHWLQVWMAKLNSESDDLGMDCCV